MFIAERRAIAKSAGFPLTVQFPSIAGAAQGATGMEDLLNLIKPIYFMVASQTGSSCNSLLSLLTSYSDTVIH